VRDADHPHRGLAPVQRTGHRRFHRCGAAGLRLDGSVFPLTRSVRGGIARRHVAASGRRRQCGESTDIRSRRERSCEDRATPFPTPVVVLSTCSIRKPAATRRLRRDSGSVDLSRSAGWHSLPRRRCAPVGSRLTQRSRGLRSDGSSAKLSSSRLAECDQVPFGE
jgi:hypothetical protein